MEKTELTEKDIYCIARIIQSSVFAEGWIFYGCQYCRYKMNAKSLLKMKMEK